MSAPGRLDILADVLQAVELQSKRIDAMGRYITLCAEADARLWDDLAEMRDDLHAVVNRVESVARAVLDPRHPLLPREGDAA